MRAEWSDVRTFLAVARSGTTSAAARLLGVNQTTCARRVATLERDLGASLFERTAHGYVLNRLGSSLLAPAEAMESAAAAFAAKLAEVERQDGRVVRLTTTDWMAEHIAQPAITRFARLHPDIRIILAVEDRRTDLTGGEADVALRGGFEPTEPTLIARRIAETPWAFYCGHGYAARNGAPRTMREALGHPLAAPAGQAEAVLRTLRPDVRIAYSTNSTAALVEAIAANDFVGPLPVWVAEDRADLHLCCAVEYRIPYLWVLYPERLRRVAHVRAFVDHLSSHARSWWRRRGGSPEHPSGSGRPA